MKIKLIYILIGAIVIIGMFSTKIDTIDKETLELIENAGEIDLDNELWPGYKLSDYPIDVNYGKVEFKYDEGNITKQKPSIEVLALSVYSEETGPVIKVIPKSMARKIIDTMGNMSKKEREYTYISFLFHEGLHAFQIDNGIVYNIDKDKNRYKRFTNILNRLDNDKKYQSLWVEEMNCLIDYFKNDSKELWAKSYNQRMKYLKKLLKDDFNFYMEMENEIELMEGTARYVEDKILGILTEKFIETDFDGSYYNGKGKFYTSGRLKSLILDKGEEWKINLFDSGKTLTDLIWLNE